MLRHACTHFRMRAIYIRRISCRHSTAGQPSPMAVAADAPETPPRASRFDIYFLPAADFSASYSLPAIRFARCLDSFARQFFAFLRAKDNTRRAQYLPDAARDFTQHLRHLFAISPSTKKSHSSAYKYFFTCLDGRDSAKLLLSMPYTDSLLLCAGRQACKHCVGRFRTLR